MAAATQAALLDELMGRNRNAVTGHEIHVPHWSDPEVCKFFLCGFCPYDLFTNTKADLGGCNKLHDVKIREDYQKSSRFEIMGYEESLSSFLRSLVVECDRRIQRAFERIALDRSTKEAFYENDPRFARVKELSKKISESLKKAEELGCNGEVLESQKIMLECENMLREKEHFEQVALGNNMGKDLDVCNICGAFKIKDDLPCRQEEHLQGKMHIGYDLIRSFLNIFDSKQEERDKRRIEAEREHKDYQTRSHSRSHGRSREKSTKSSRRYEEYDEIHSHSDRNLYKESSRNRSRSKDYNRNNYNNNNIVYRRRSRSPDRNHRGFRR